MKKSIIGVQFKQEGNIRPTLSKVYYYFTTEDFEKGDHAVVQVNDELKIVLVSEVNVSEFTNNANKATKYIVQKVDMNHFEKQKEKLEQEREEKLELARLLILEKELREVEAIVKESTNDRIVTLAKKRIEQIKQKMEG